MAGPGLAVGLGAGAGAALGWGAKTLYQNLRTRKLVTGYAPIIYLELGTSATLAAKMIRKPRWQRDFVDVNGDLTFAGGGPVFTIEGAATVTKFGTAAGSVTVLGTRVGTGKITVSGTGVDGETYDELNVPVEVVEPISNFLSLYAGASAKAQDAWFNGKIGNALINVGMLGRKGLCDEWMEWTEAWCKEQGRGRVVKIERVFYDGVLDHNCCRVTLSNGQVYYFDPHRLSDPPYMTQADYESAYGTPTDTWVWWP